MNKKPILGSGQRFKNLQSEFAREGIDDPAALAAAMGRKKYGNQKMAEMAAAGMKRALLRRKKK